MTFVPSKFGLDSSIELVADHWSAEAPSTILFRNAHPNDRMNLSAGLITPAGIKNIQAVVEGVIDEYEIDFSPTEVRQRLRGRDASAHALDTFVDIQFRKGPPVASIERVAGAPVADIRYGVWTARAIAEIVVEATGLTLAWGVRDYTLTDIFSAQGRVVDILRRLIEPWTIVAPFAADVYIRGTQIIVAYRAQPTEPFVADSTFSALASRRSQVTVRLRRLRKYGRVVLTGRGVPEGLSTVLGGGFSSGTHTVEDVAEQFNENEELISRTVTITVFRTPERIPISVIKSTFTRKPPEPLVLTNRETIEVDLEPSVYNDAGPVNSPKTRGKITTVQALDPEDDIFKIMAQEILEYKYDTVGFLKFEGTLKRALDPETGVLTDSTLVTKDYSVTGALDVVQLVQSFTFDTEELRWRRTARDETRSGGHRAGGPNRGQSTAGLEAGDAADRAFKAIVVEKEISADVTALPFAYNNPNLNLEDLNFLMTLFEAASGLIEYEVVLTGVAIPWLRRGAIVQITGLHLEDGTTYTLPPAKITEVRIVYDESKTTPDFMMPVVRAFAWEVPV